MPIEFIEARHKSTAMLKLAKTNLFVLHFCLIACFSIEGTWLNFIKHVFVVSN